MGPGRTVGRQLKAWLDSQAFDVTTGPALANHLVDALGDAESLLGPLRDLASQPLFRQVLLQRGGGQRATLDQLNQRLSATYSPAVLHELQDLLEEATGLTLARRPPDIAARPADPVPVVQSPTGIPINRPPAGQRPSPENVLRGTPSEERGGTLMAVLADLKRIAPGAALAAGSALVLWWAAGCLEALLPGRDGGGVLLVVLLLLFQALTQGPLRGLRHLWPLTPASAIDPSQAWRWVLSPWIHQRGGEGLALNLALLFILLSAPAGIPLLSLRSLDLPAVVLGYCLTTLVTTIPAALLARRYQVQKTWGGGAGMSAALVTLAAVEGLIHRRVVHLGVSPLLVPAWVLLLIIGALALQMELPRPSRESSRPWQRLLASSWCWGTVLGLSVGLGDGLLRAIQALLAAWRP